MSQNNPAKAYATPVSCQYVTPACRENRGAEGAIDEALRRVRKSYMDYVAAPENADAHWHIVLYRVDEEAKAKLEMREPVFRSGPTA